MDVADPNLNVAEVTLKVTNPELAAHLLLSHRSGVKPKVIPAQISGSLQATWHMLMPTSPKERLTMTALGVPTLTPDLDHSNASHENGSTSGPSRDWRRSLFGWLKRSGRQVLTIGLVVAVATLTEQHSIGAVPAVALAVVVGAIEMIAGRRKYPARWPRFSFVAGALLFTMLASVTWSYNTYLNAPGAATTSVRTSDWMRDHGMSPLVDRVEQYLYADQPLGNGHISANQIPAAAIAKRVRTAPQVENIAPMPVVNLIDNTLKGEGKWSPSGRLVNGHPVAFTTFIRPDRSATDVVATAAWLDPTATAITYVPGTKQSGSWAWQSGVPAAKRSGLVAAFNSGFNFKDIPGGYFTEGRTPIPLIDGQASLILGSNGQADIGSWGSEVKMAPDVVSVRQNLQLIVDHGVPVPAIQTSTAGEWGSRRWQIQHTNRSGICIASNHALVYVAGSNLTTETLSIAMANVGCVRGMELDIHASNPTFNFFYPDPSGASVVGSKLTQSMQSSANRYLVPDQRDFFAVTLK